MRKSMQNINFQTADWTSIHSSQHSAFRANPFSKGTDPICRLPSSAFFYRPGVINPGDLMRLLVRLESGLYFPWGFKDHWKHTGVPASAGAYTHPSSFSPDKLIKGFWWSKSKENAPRSFHWHPKLYCVAANPLTSKGMFAFFPFKTRGIASLWRANFSFRTD